MIPTAPEFSDLKLNMVKGQFECLKTISEILGADSFYFHFPLGRMARNEKGIITILSIAFITFALLQLSFAKIQLNNQHFDDYLKELSEYNVTLRDWPWENWGEGPPCPIRHHKQLVSIKNSSVIKLAIENVKLLMEAEINNLAAINILPGITISIVYGDEVLYAQGFGRINKTSTEAPTADTIYDVGSVTKIFTSLALFQTISQEKVSLDAKVTDYFNQNNPPIFDINNPYSIEGADAVTLRSLAAQSSGLPREAYCGVYPLTLACLNKNEAAQLNFNALSKIGLLYSPLTGSHYSNLGLALLGRTLERVWGEEYEDYMVDNIFTPIGMNSSGFVFTQDVIDKMAVGYLIEGPNANGTYYMVRTKYNRMEMGWSAPCGGLYTSTNDLIKFFQFIFDDANQFSNVINKTALNSYLTPGMLLPDGISLYGSGTFETFYANGYWTLTKGGLAEAMAASISMVPELKLGVSTLLNVNSGYQADSMNAKIMRIMVPAVLIALQENQVPVALPPSYEQYLGTYGYSINAPILILNDTSDGSGVLTGYVNGPGSSYFIWDSAQDYNGATAFRYSSVQTSYISCMSLNAVGNNAIAYFSLQNGKPVVTVADENLSFYFLAKLD